MSVFQNRNDYLGEQELTLPNTGTEVSLTVPVGAAYARIWFNPVGTTGTNEVYMYYGTDSKNIIVFQDAGGYIEITGPLSLSQFRAAAMNGVERELQIYYHASPTI